MATAASAAMSVTKSAAALPMKKGTDFRRGSSSSRVARVRASASVEKSGGGDGNASGGCNNISSNGGGEGKKGVPINSMYVVPLVEKAAAGVTRPLAEILRDLNKRVPDKIINQDDNTIPWYHANRMLSFYAPG